MKRNRRRPVARTYAHDELGFETWLTLFACFAAAIIATAEIMGV